MFTHPEEGEAQCTTAITIPASSFNCFSSMYRNHTNVTWTIHLACGSLNNQRWLFRRVNAVTESRIFQKLPAGFRRIVSERTHPAVIMIAAIWVYVVEVIVKVVIVVISTAFRLRVQRVFLDEVYQSNLVSGCGLCGPAIQCLLSAIFPPAGSCHDVWLASGALKSLNANLRSNYKARWSVQRSCALNSFASGQNYRIPDLQRFGEASHQVARHFAFQQFVELILDDDTMAEQAYVVLPADMLESMLYFIQSIHLGLRWTQLWLWHDFCTSCTLSLYMTVAPACSWEIWNSWMGHRLIFHTRQVTFQIVVSVGCIWLGTDLQMPYAMGTLT